MKVCEADRALTKRDLLNKLAKVLKALGEQSQRADAAERECDRLRAQLIRVRERSALPDHNPSVKR